ncbi:MAG: hypothetical protein AAGB48_07820 [Planctomycetota bacterium]
MGVHLVINVSGWIVDHIITARRFMDRLGHLMLGEKKILRDTSKAAAIR